MGDSEAQKRLNKGRQSCCNSTFLKRLLENIQAKAESQESQGEISYGRKNVRNAVFLALSS